MQPNFKTPAKGCKLKALNVNIIGLGKKENHFQYELGDAFFESYAYGSVSGGSFVVTVIVDKHDTFIEARFAVEGNVRLVCDRSLRPFQHPVKVDKKIVFKYGEEETELSDEIVVIKRERATLDLGQYVYEFIVLDLPMKRLHPDFGNEEDDSEEGKMIYTSGGDDTSEENDVDPRWEQLKKLK